MCNDVLLTVLVLIVLFVLYRLLKSFFILALVGLGIIAIAWIVQKIKGAEKDFPAE